jgi:hypothetical protein
MEVVSSFLEAGNEDRYRQMVDSGRQIGLREANKLEGEKSCETKVLSTHT